MSAGSEGTNPIARVLAVLAVVVSILALGVVVATSLGGDDGESSDSGATGAAECNPKAGAAVDAGYYIIKPAENLEVIAARTCLDADTLAELNPDLDPFALQADSCLNLEPKGCKKLEE